MVINTAALARCRGGARRTTAVLTAYRRSGNRGKQLRMSQTSHQRGSQQLCPFSSLQRGAGGAWEGWTSSRLPTYCPLVRLHCPGKATYRQSSGLTHLTFEKSLQYSVLQPFAKNHNFSEKSLKYLLTNKCFNCNVRLMNDPLRPSEWKGGIMKDELRSESQAEICWGGKIREILIFLPNLSFCHSFPLAENRASQSK